MASRWGVVLAALVCVSCDEKLPTGPSGGDPIRRVQGRVLDFASQSGLPGVTVGFGRNFPDVLFQTTTDASGAYTLDLPAGELIAIVDGVFAGTLAVHVGGPAFRGDLFGNVGNCVSRYGSVIDGDTFRPVAGATVSLGGQTAVTGPDGWYRLDFGCTGYLDFGTTFIYVTHPGHQNFQRVVGRGIGGASRIDALLLRS